MFSGNWNNGVNAGSRAVNANNYPWNVNTNIGVRLACDNFLIANNKERATDYGLRRGGIPKRKIVRLVIRS
jgi:hypothetical protein